MFARLLFCVMLSAALVGPVQADDFLSDLAGCASTPISAAKFATGDAKKAAGFVINHGECVPMVVGGDPILYGATGGFVALQAAGSLPTSYGGCVDATLGQASQQVANVLKAYVNTPPLSSIMPAAGKAKLVQIAQGEIQDGLYSVPGIAVVADRLDCACAVTSSGVNINALKERIKDVVDSAGDCKKVLGKLVGGAYSIAKGAVGAGKDLVNSVGCTLGFGGCSSGPPLFCTGYFSMRDQGITYDSLSANEILGKMFAEQLQACEQKYANVLADRQKKALADAEKKLFDQEMAKAEHLGAANALGFAFRWVKKCLDAECKGSIAKFADMYTADITNPETIQYYKTFKIAVAAMEKKYGALAEIALILSKKRVMKDLNAAAELRLQAFDCVAFLGRPRQSLCPTSAGFAACRTYVNGERWDACALTGKPGMYSAHDALDRLVRRGGCIPERSRSAGYSRLPVSPVMTAQCLAARARSACDILRNGGSALRCQGPDEIARFDVSRYRVHRPLVQPMPGLRPVPVEPAPQPVPPPIRVAPAFRPIPVPQAGTICAFDAGPRAGQRQDYAPMAALAVGSPCHDGRGSTGRVVAQ